jgi:hypothetical protein
MSEVFREVSDQIAIAELTTADDLRSVFERVPAGHPDRMPSRSEASLQAPGVFVAA